MFRKTKNEKTELSAEMESTPKKRKKPQDRSKLTRNSQVQIRLTEEEVFALKTAAKENDMSLADFVMSGINQTRRIVVPGAGELRAEIIRVGNNLNQAVRIAHILRKEGKAVDAIGIELSADRAVDVLDELHIWLEKWDVDLAYQNNKGGK